MAFLNLKSIMVMVNNADHFQMLNQPRTTVVNPLGHDVLFFKYTPGFGMLKLYLSSVHMFMRERTLPFSCNVFFWFEHQGNASLSE